MHVENKLWNAIFNQVIVHFFTSHSYPPMESNKDVLIEGKGIGSEYTNMMVNDR